MSAPNTQEAHAEQIVRLPPSNNMTDPNTLTKSPSKRLPAPALFVGPPSRNASDASLLSPDSKATRNPLGRQRSLLTQDSARRPLPPQSTRTEEDGEQIRLTSSNPNAPFIRRQNQANQAAEVEATSRTEALWAEMQSTLEEVELGAMNGPEMTVFRPEHSRALDELRRAQIELAKAWAKSEAEEIGEFGEERETVKETNATNLLAANPIEKPEDDTPVSAGGLGGTFDRSELEKETEKDIELSRLRREANDRYFEKVNNGVQEVALKLEEVAKAMRGVESESKEIWGHGDDASIETKSVTTAPSIT